MAKLITKFKYLKPNARQSVGGYAKYIATREGVEKIDQSYRLSPCSLRQQQLIEKILKDFPDSKEMLEYEDYLKEPTVGNASEFADYIATRPRAERFGSHGLFTDDGIQVKLGEVSDELNHHDGNVWTVIISLRREDAERLGYNNGERWRDMLRTKTNALAKSFKICAWIVTSSAVVGSSAIKISAFEASAIAIITLCFIPPESSWGYDLILFFASLNSTLSSVSSAIFKASSFEIEPLCSIIASRS